jgi:2-polyprenyl-3-methyl-5-hydroxy-6-metoxy-1,4-benzoquinol methylase
MDIPNKTIADIIEWDVQNWSQLLTYWEPILKKLPPDGKILAFGERNGGLSLWLAMQGFHVDCTDRVRPTDAAVEMHKRYHVADKITYGSFDVVNSSMEGNKYDLIIAKSVLGGIKSDYKNATTRTSETRENAIKNIYNLLKPNGYILFAENIQGSVLLHKVRKMLGKQKGWYYFNISDFNNLFKTFHDVEIKTFGVIPTTSRNRYFNDFIFALNKYLLNVLPSSYKYIAFIQGQKK